MTIAPCTVILNLADEPQQSTVSEQELERMMNGLGSDDLERQIKEGAMADVQFGLKQLQGQIEELL